MPGPGRQHRMYICHQQRRPRYLPINILLRWLLPNHYKPAMSPPCHPCGGCEGARGTGGHTSHADFQQRGVPLQGRRHVLRPLVPDLVPWSPGRQSKHRFKKNENSKRTFVFGQKAEHAFLPLVQRGANVSGMHRWHGVCWHHNVPMCQYVNNMPYQSKETIWWQRKNWVIPEKWHKSISLLNQKGIENEKARHVHKTLKKKKLRPNPKIVKNDTNWT